MYCTMGANLRYPEISGPGICAKAADVRCQWSFKDELFDYARDRGLYSAKVLGIFSENRLWISSSTLVASHLFSSIYYDYTYRAVRVVCA